MHNYREQQYLSGYLRSRADEIRSVVKTAHDNQLLEDKGSYMASLIEQFRVNELQPHFDRAEVSRNQRQASGAEMQSLDMTFGRRFGQRHSHSPDAVNVLVYHLPISGDTSLLRYDPSSSYRASLPQLLLENGEVSFEVVINANMPHQTESQIQNYAQWLQHQIQHINNDLRPYNLNLPNVVQQIVDAEAAARSKILGVVESLAIPMRKSKPVVIDAAANTNPIPIQNHDKYYTVGISFGAGDESIANELNTFLTSLGIKTFFFPVHAIPGDKLHRMMFHLANDNDRVLLVCSKESLNRNGVLHEIEKVLEREASMGGASILIPVRLDDYVLNEWSPERPDVAAQVRNRVIGKLSCRCHDFG